MAVRRPQCEFGGVGGCDLPATRMVGFGDPQGNLREHKHGWRMSCAAHAEAWRKRGGYWVSSLMGWVPDPDSTLARDLEEHWRKQREPKLTAEEVFQD